MMCMTFEHMTASVSNRQHSYKILAGGWKFTLRFLLSKWLAHSPLCYACVYSPRMRLAICTMPPALVYNKPALVYYATSPSVPCHQP